MEGGEGQDPSTSGPAVQEVEAGGQDKVVTPLKMGWRASSSPLVDASCPVCVWLKEIHMRDRGLTHTTLDQKEFGEKVWSPFACALNLQGFRFQQRLGPHLSPYSFPEDVKA